MLREKLTKFDVFKSLNVEAVRNTVRYVSMCLLGGVLGGLIIEYLPTWFILLGLFFIVTSIVYRLELLEMKQKQNDQESNQ